MRSLRIIRIEWCQLEGRRPRAAGSNARLGDHGVTVRVPLLRLTTEDGTAGFGRAAVSGPEQASALLGQPLDALVLQPDGGPPFVSESFRPLEYPLWDLAAKHADLPVFRFVCGEPGTLPPEGASLRVPCYDTSLYFDDLHLAEEQAAAELLAAEAREGWERGHRAFKIKVGRGARHLPLEQGTRRDLAIVRAVRAAVGQDAPLMLDANNGWNLNLAKRALTELADCGIYWLEEAFHEDPVLYRDLRAWLAERGLTTLIADGEGSADPRLLQWAQEGVMDVIQYDIFSYGFSRWLALGRQLDSWNVRTAPHHYGGHVGNYVTCHLAPAIHSFTFVEWDEVTAPGLDASGYAIRDGLVSVPDTAGFGLALDEAFFERLVGEIGFRMEIT